MLGLLPGTACPGDANGDGAVNIGDLNVVLVNFVAFAVGVSGGDLDGDGDVDVADLNLVLSRFEDPCD